MVQLGLDDAGLMRLLLFGPGQGLWRHSAGAATGPASLQLLCQAQQGHSTNHPAASCPVPRQRLASSPAPRCPTGLTTHTVVFREESFAQWR